MRESDITRETFLDLLAAAYNICPQAEPGDEEGANMTNTALETARVLFDLMEQKGKGHQTGVLIVVNILSEVSNVENSEAYAAKEAQRGWSGERASHGQRYRRP